MRNFLLSGSAVLALAAAAALARADTAPPTGLAALIVRLHAAQVSPGEEVRAEVGPDGAFLVRSRSTLAATDALTPPASDPRIETLEHWKGAPARLPPDTLAAAFQTFAAGGGALRVQNGFDHPILYDAAILLRRGPQLVASTTSICPVSAHGVGTEAWGGRVEGVLIYNVREPPAGDMRCSRGSGLSAATTRINMCLGAPAGSPVAVRLGVDPSKGERREAEAEWTLRAAGPAAFAPQVTFVFPMERDEVAARPGGLRVLAFLDARAPPSSKAASIVLLQDGVEVERRPWRLFADRMRAYASTPVGARPVAFIGSAPFPLRAEDGRPDPKLAGLFADIGSGRAGRLEVRVEGDDGVLISRADYALQPPAVRDGGLLQAALRSAEALAQAPDHCAPASADPPAPLESGRRRPATAPI